MTYHVSPTVHCTRTHAWSWIRSIKIQFKSIATVGTWIGDDPSVARTVPYEYRLPCEQRYEQGRY